MTKPNAQHISYKFWEIIGSGIWELPCLFSCKSCRVRSAGRQTLITILEVRGMNACFFKQGDRL